MSLLTQYIGPSTGAGPEIPEEDEGNSDLKTELETLNKDFLSQTDTLDWGQKHLEALDRAVAKRRILARLKITIQLQVLLKEDADFQKDWADNKLECELRLIEMLWKHLRLRVSQQNVRNLGRDTFLNIRRLASSTEATEAIDQTLQEAEKERKERNELRAKRKLEAATSNDKKQQNQNKRRKPDSK